MMLLKNCLVHKTEKAPPADDKAAFAATAAAIGIPLLANFAVTFVGESIEARSEGLSGQFIAGMNTDDIKSTFQPHKSESKTNYPCLAIYRGLFGEAKPAENRSTSELTEDDLTTLGLVDYPAFYMEMRGELKGNSLTLTPKYIWYADTVARSRGSGEKHVGVVLAMTEQVLKRESDPPTDADTLALFRFDLGRLEIGKSYLEEPGRPLLTGTGAVQPIRIEGEDKKPANLLAYVIESEDPDLVLAAFSEALESQEDDLISALTDFLRDAAGTD